jgi:nucleoid-associated protein
VVYNPHNDSITIYKVPPNLKEQLQALLVNPSNPNDDDEFINNT